MLDVQLGFILVLLVSCSIVMGVLLCFLIFRPTSVVQAAEETGAFESRMDDIEGHTKELQSKLSESGKELASMGVKTADDGAPTGSTELKQKLDESISELKALKSEVSPAGSSKEDDDVLNLLQKKPSK